jgi:CRISPR-associated protein Csd1
LAWWYENQIAEVMSRIRDSIPGTLTLAEQSLFALGYYQQLAALNAGKGSGKNESDTARHSNDPADGHKE